MSGLLVPTDVADIVIDVLNRRHPEHLALFERQRGLAPQTLPRLATCDHLAGEGFRLKTDRVPAVLVGMFGSADPPSREKDGIVVPWTMAVEITMAGQDRGDTLRARDWYTMTVLQCILDRVPRSGAPIDSLRWEDIDLVPGVDEESQRVVAQARLLFSVGTRGVLGESGLPVDNTPIPPGTPGGPPSSPYTPPQPWPLAETVTTTTQRDPIE